MSEKVQTVAHKESEWASDGADWSDDEFSDCSGDGKSSAKASAPKIVSKVLAESNRIQQTPTINTGVEMNNENVYVIHAGNSDDSIMEQNRTEDPPKEKVDNTSIIVINDETEPQKAAESTKDEVIQIDDDDQSCDAAVSKRKYSDCELIISDSDASEKAEEETKVDEVLFVVDEFEEYESLKDSNMLAHKRLKALLANQHFYVEDEYHIFDETATCPAIKVNTFILKVIPNVFPENYKPITKSEKPQVQDKPIEVDMIVMESDEDYQKRSPAGYPQFRDIALRRRLTDMLKRNKFSIDGDYHVFEKTQKFPLLKIKTALIAHFCFKINGDEPAAKKKKVIPVVEEEDSEDEFLVTSFYTEPEVDIEDGNRLPDNEMDVEIQKEKPDQSSVDADVIHQNSAHESLENMQTLIIEEHV